MSDNHQDPSAESTDAIRIVGINTDKTRRTVGSETSYHVYFKLSQAPTQVWRVIFLDQWKAMNPAPKMTRPEAVIDGSFLFIDCPLKEVDATYLPVLKKAVAATNVSYKLHLQREATAQASREDVWKDERKSVEEMAAALHFE